MNCDICHRPIVEGDLYFEAYRKGEHDVQRMVDEIYSLHVVPLKIHLRCPRQGDGGWI